MSHFSATRVKNQSHEVTAPIAPPVVVDRIGIGSIDSFSDEGRKSTGLPLIRASIAKAPGADVSREYQRSVCRTLIQEMLEDRLIGEFAAGAETAWTLKSSETGAPRLVHRGLSPSIHVSLAHSGPWIAVALARGARVGIDIEQKKPRANVAAMAEYMGWADRVTDLNGFLSRWTLWEACVKLEESSIFNGENAAFDALGKNRSNEALYESGTWASLNRNLKEGAFLALAIHRNGRQPLEIKG